MYGSYNKFSCKTALEEPYVSGLKTKLHSLSVDFRKLGPQKALNLTQEQMNQRKLTMKLDCPTRLNSTLDMIQRALECWGPLSSVLIQYPEYAKNFPTNEIENLNPFKEVTQVVSSEKKINNFSGKFLFSNYK